jgi:hypothetical protein
MGTWVKELMAAIASRQLRAIHFQQLNDRQKSDVCSLLATKKVRLFAVASNKQNMEGYHNPAAAQVPSNNWFYCWLTRILLERRVHSLSKGIDPLTSVRKPVPQQ